MRCFIFDLDGTLLSDSKTISERNADAIKAIANKAVVVIASGRHFREIIRFMEGPGIVPNYIISCDGLYGHDSSGKLVYQAPFFDAADVEEIASFFPRKHIVAISDEADYLVGQSLKDSLISPFSKKKLQAFRLKRGSKIEKVRIYASKTKKGQRSFLEKNFAPCFVAGKYIDVLPKGVSKYSAIRAIMDLKCLTPEEVVFFGDDHNDRECFEKLKYCVAMENSVPEIKTKAFLVTKTNNDDGVAHGLSFFTTDHQI